MSAINTASQTQQHDQGARLAVTIERMIRPLIKLIVGRVSCGFLVQQIKLIYIQEARSWIEQNDPNGRVTKSKLAMLTGLDTRTISSIETEQQAANEYRVRDLCPEAGVLDKWKSSKPFIDRDGDAKVLPIFGKTVAFQALVSSVVGRNVTCLTVLERLVESGNIEIVDDDFVKLVNPFYQPIKPSDETIIEAGSWSITRLIGTVEHNLHTSEKDQRLLQQDRYSTRIPSSLVDEATAEVRKVLEKQIQEVEKVLEKYEATENQEGHRVLGIGWFSFTDKTE